MQRAALSLSPVLGLALALGGGVGCQGPAGTASLVRVTPEPEGANCPLGGVRIDTGFDRNENGRLDPGEIIATEYVCQIQADGYTSLVNIDDIAPGGACGEGTGKRITSGLDLNEDGVLSPSEVQTEAILCNGRDGDDGLHGVNGTDGDDGLTSLVRVETLPPDPDGACFFGGMRVQSGLDLNGDGVLSPNEVTDEAVVCSIHVNEHRTLIEQRVELPGDNCEFGGIRYVVGYDANGNGELDPDERGEPGYVCNELMVVDGVSTLLDITDANGSQCAFGGYVLRSGADTNRNGQLDVHEIQSTAVVCNGNDGYNSLVNMAPAGAQCGEEGGQVVTSGLDLNRNGTLDPNEVMTTGLVCNGRDGFLGYDGLNSLIRIRDDGGACGYPGGFILEVGLDLNENGILDPDEVEDWEYVCNGFDGYDTLIYTEEDFEFCNYGGIRIESGRDFNEDGVLQLDEVEHVTYVCDGAEGYTALVDIEEAAPWECPLGGFWFLTGLDLNFNGFLDEFEIENEYLLCF